jgi:uncharacterized protein (TIGR03545 family)
MIRWGYLIPRLAIVCTIVGFLTLGLSPLARWALVTYGSRTMGARIDVEGLELSPWRTEIQVSQTAITNPASPMRNLFELHEGTFTLDRDALLQRKFVVRQGQISGLRFDTVRSNSGAIALPEEEEDEGGGFSFPAIDDQWFKSLAGKLQDDLESELKTPGLCRELAERYPQEYRQLESQVQSLIDRVEHLRDLIRQVRENPLQDPATYEDLVRQIAEAREQLAQVQPELGRLREMVSADRQAVSQAKQHDEAYVRERLRLESLDPDAISQYLLGQEQAARLQSALAWIRRVRKCIPSKRELAGPQRGRGRIVNLPGVPRTPDLLFERLAIDGQIAGDTDTASFSGSLCGVTHQPQLYGRPATFSVATGGPTPLQIHGVIDRTGAVSHDKIVVRCPAFTLPRRQLGKAQSLAVSIAPSSAALTLEIDLRDEALSGQFAFEQNDLQMETQLPQAYGSQYLQSRLNETLDGVSQVRVAVDLSGTLRRPRGRLRSDLGSQLAEGFQNAFQQELDARAGQIAARVDQYVQEQFSELERIVDGKQQELLARLEEPRRELEQLALPAAEQLGIFDQIKLPAAARTGSLPVSDWLRR